MPTKETTPVKDTSNLIFVSVDKKRRAEDIYLILNGKNPKESVSADTKAYLNTRFSELMSDAGVTLKDHDEAILFIYKTLGGALRTPEQHSRIKKAGNISKGKAAKEASEEGEDEDDDD